MSNTWFREYTKRMEAALSESESSEVVARIVPNADRTGFEVKLTEGKIDGSFPATKANLKKVGISEAAVAKAKADYKGK